MTTLLYKELYQFIKIEKSFHLSDFDSFWYNNEKTTEFYKYAYLAAAYNKREKKENWDDREESGFRAYSRSSPIVFTEFSFM